MTNERGSALVYILIAIALLAALTVTFMEPSSQQATSQNTFETVSEVGTQVNFIRSSIQECVLSYPGGDSGRMGAVNHAYPFNPTSTYLTSPDALSLVRHIRCPGNPGNSANHADIFAAASGKFMPPPPTMFSEWYYHSGVEGVFFVTATAKTDAFLLTALQKLDDQFSRCEADVIVAGGSAVDLTNTPGEVQCPANNTCMRVWVLTRPAAAGSYRGDTESNEVGCPN